MIIDFDSLASWLQNNVILSDSDSPQSLRIMTHHILMGKNYRHLTEQKTKDKLILTYVWLYDLVTKAKKELGNHWQQKMIDELQSRNCKPKELKNLMYWLVGLTDKTCTNIGESLNSTPNAMSDLLIHVKTMLKDINREESIDMAWMMLMSGSATLNIRGSEKSFNGKRLEKIIIRSILAILGMVENEHFWINLDRDDEVDRETDAEIQTRRTRIRVEVGLIAPGNQEVIEDKIGRVGRNGIVIFDKVGKNSRIQNTADKASVKLIQLRNNQPLKAVYQHISPLMDIEIQEPPETSQDIKDAIMKLPDDVFLISRKQ